MKKPVIALVLVLAFFTNACSATGVAEPEEPEATVVVESEPEPAETETTPEPEPSEPSPEPEPTPTATEEVSKPEQEQPPALKANYVFGDGVSARTQEAVVGALAYSIKFTEDTTGYRDDNFTLFVFAEPENLVDHYMKFHNMPESRRADLLSQWGHTRAGEAGRGNIFLLTDLIWESAKADSALALSFFTHEYAHVLQWSFTSNVSSMNNATPPIGPVWLVEGSAEYLAASHMHEIGQETLSERRLRWKEQASAADKPLHSLETWSGMNSVGDTAGYALGALAVHQLVKQHGISSLLEYSEAIGSAGSWRPAFQQTFGVSIEQFYENFKDKDPRN